MFVYVGSYTSDVNEPRGVHVFRGDEAGRLTPIEAVPETPNASWLSMHPRGNVLYAVSEVSTWDGKAGGGITALEVDSSSGTLNRINDRPTGGTPVHSTVHMRGTYLLAANYIGASYAVLPLRPDGGLEPASDVHPVSGRGPVAGRQDEPHPHQVLFDPNGRRVFGVDLGTDKIWSWQLDEAAGELEPADLPYLQVASGAGPRHAVFHPGGRFVYVADELASTVTAFSYDPSRGTFTWLQTAVTIPPGFAGENYPAEIAIHPSGRFLYVSNRGHDTIAIFTVDVRTGRLGDLAWEPTQGAWPRHFAIAPSGQLMLVANQNSNTVVAFRIESGTGRLQPTGEVTELESPVCVSYGGH